MTESQRFDTDHDDMKELLDLLEKLVEFPSGGTVSQAGIRAAYRRKLFKDYKPKVVRTSTSTDALWEMLHQERTVPLERVLKRQISKK